MELLGIGPLEFFFVLAIVLLLFSPKDIVGGARKLGQTLNRLYKSDTFQIIQKTSAGLRNLPDRLAREAALEDLDKLASKMSQEITTAAQAPLPNTSGSAASSTAANSLLPPDPAQTKPPA